MSLCFSFVGLWFWKIWHEVLFNWGVIFSCYKPPRLPIQQMKGSFSQSTCNILRKWCRQRDKGFGRHSNPSFRTWATSISVSQDPNFLDIVLYPNSRISVGLYSQLFTCRLQSLSQNCFKLPKKATKDRQGFGTLKLGSPRSRCCVEDHQLFPPENDQQWFVNMKHSSKVSRLFPLTFRAWPQNAFHCQSDFF